LNFFGHAVVAGWADPQAGHRLGSMLPDFEAMVRVPLLEVRDPDIQRGIDLHHRTDEAFHRAPVFLSLCARALDKLSRAGVRRGTARAVGHIGSEMFLDGWLAREQDYVDDYLTALEVDVDDRLRWQDDGLAFSKLHTRLTTWGAPRDYAEPAFVSARLTDAIRHRPALAVLEDESAQVETFLPHLQRMVERQAAELLTELQGTLGLGD
jgi:acyl carrier protein phosphodiesterase